MSDGVWCGVLSTSCEGELRVSDAVVSEMEDLCCNRAVKIRAAGNRKYQECVILKQFDLTLIFILKANI